MSIQSNANQAALERLWSHTVGIANSALSSEGTDPATGQRGREEEAPGTGTAGVWGTNHFVLTAKHVVEKAEINDLRFFVRQIGALKTQGASTITRQDGVEPVRVDDPNAVIHRCDWEDLAVVTLQPNALGTMLEFFDIAASWVDPPLDELISGVGYPVSYGVSLEEKRVGPISYKAILLSPTPFNGNVLPPPVGEELKFKFGGFNPERHYLIPFEHAKEGKRPEGISGAAAWVQSGEHHVLWAARFKFAGTCTSCHMNGTIEQIVKASVVRKFLTEVFGAA